MKVLFINSSPDTSDITFESMLNQIEFKFQVENHQTERITTRNMNIKYCNGCWNCWVKSPGKCSIKDDMHIIHKAVINADLVVFISQLKMGFITSEMKKVQERLIPLLLPYIDIVEDECHHKKRYEKYPKLALIMKPEVDTTDEDIQINVDIFRRMALNFRTEVLFTSTYEHQFEDVIYETCNFKRFSPEEEKQLEVVNG